MKIFGLVFSLLFASNRCGLFATVVPNSFKAI